MHYIGSYGMLALGRWCFAKVKEFTTSTWTYGTGNHADQRRGNADAMCTFAMNNLKLKSRGRNHGRAAGGGDLLLGPKLGKTEGSRLGWSATG